MVKFRYGQRLTFTPVFLLVYGLSLAALYFGTSPPNITEGFSGPLAEKYHVATVNTDASKQQFDFGHMTLAAVQDGKASGLTFLLPQAEISIPGGDTHRAKVLEEHGKWQLIQYDFLNTYSSTARYRAYANRVEPISYRVTSSVAMVFSGLLLLLPAIAVAATVTIIWNAVSAWKARS